MIDFYTGVTPNGFKVAIMLEECGLAYKPHFLEIFKGEASSESHLKHNPIGKIPSIVDHSPTGSDAPLTLFESGAILQYLGEKTGKFLPKDPLQKAKVIQWLTAVTTGQAIAFMQRFQFTKLAPEPIPYALEKFAKESHRYMQVFEKQLASNDYLAEDYSIADMALYPWLKMAQKMFSEEVTQYPNLLKYIERLEKRPAVERGMLTPVPSA